VNLNQCDGPWNNENNDTSVTGLGCLFVLLYTAFTFGAGLMVGFVLIRVML